MLRKTKWWAFGMAGLLAASILLVGATSSSKATDNSDDAKAAIQRLIDSGILQGDSTGNLGLDKSITRATFATIMAKALGLEKELKNKVQIATFSDVKTSAWYAEEVAAAQKLINANGFDLGVGGGKFAPDKPLSTIETLAFLEKFLGTKVEKGESEDSNWITDTISAAIVNKLITADQAKNFSNKTIATRGFVFQLSDNAFMNYPLETGKTVYETYHSDSVTDYVYSDNGAGTAP